MSTKNENVVITTESGLSKLTKKELVNIILRKDSVEANNLKTIKELESEVKQLNGINHDFKKEIDDNVTEIFRLQQKLAKGITVCCAISITIGILVGYFIK